MFINEPSERYEIVTSRVAASRMKVCRSVHVFFLPVSLPEYPDSATK